jgi:ribonuclease HI
MIHVFTDGGSRGNPGEAASGVYITEDGQELASFGIRLGITTNNVAEYTAVIEAFNWLLTHREKISNSSGISFFMDSKLVASQLSGLFKVKHPNMQPLFLSVKQKEKQLGLRITYTHIPREENKMADRMVNAALDNLL